MKKNEHSFLHYEQRNLIYVNEASSVNNFRSEV